MSSVSAEHAFPRSADQLETRVEADERLLEDVEELHWRGHTEAFAGCVDRLGDERLLERSLKAASR